MMVVMRTSHLVFVGVLGLAAIGSACGDDGSPSPGDASGSDAAGSDAGSANACTNALYNPCTGVAQCTSGNCRMFNMPSPGIMVCTQACAANNPCPMQNGVAVECTNAGVCRPPAANNCTR